MVMVTVVNFLSQYSQSQFVQGTYKIIITAQVTYKIMMQNVAPYISRSQITLYQYPQYCGYFITEYMQSKRRTGQCLCDHRHSRKSEKTKAATYSQTILRLSWCEFKCLTSRNVSFVALKTRFQDSLMSQFNLTSTENCECALTLSVTVVNECVYGKHLHKSDQCLNDRKVSL